MSHLHPEEPYRSIRMQLRRHPWLALTTVASLGLLVVAYAAAFLLDEPIRREMERRLNASLAGYTVAVGAADFHPFGFSLDLEDLRVVQDAAPKPPVARIDEIEASVEWRALLSGALVADMSVVRPVLHLTRQQAQREIGDDQPVQERGWQEAVQEIYPLEINEFRIVDADVTYVDPGPYDPVRVHDLDFVARNIRNVRADDRSLYPSPVELHARFLDAARLDARGAADFLATPHPTFRLSEARLEGVEIERLQPLVRDIGLNLRDGTLAMAGGLEYSADRRVVDLESVTLRDAAIDYRQRSGRKVDLVEETVELAAKPAAKPETVVRVDELRVIASEIGLVNGNADPEYRLFLSSLDVAVDGFTNDKADKPGRAELRGQFMGSGKTHLVSHFQPAAAQADFDLKLEIEQTDLTTMNDLWRAYGNFDVAGGVFAFYSSMRVENGQIEGYVKPIFTDLDIYDREQDADKNVFRQAYEGIVGGAATLLQNQPRDQVATETDLSGPVASPRTSTLQIIVGLVRNAFFSAILPGIERERGQA